jgi:hypothetical protein
LEARYDDDVVVISPIKRRLVVRADFPRGQAAVDEQSLIELSGNVDPFTRPEFDQMIPD